MRTHPPLFHTLCMRHGPHHAANVLARKLAHREHVERVVDEINLWHVRPAAILYYPPGWSEPHERDAR